MGARSTGRINGTLVLRTLRSIPEECKRRAERGKSFAETIAPVDTGLYKASFTVREVEAPGGFRGARLANDAKSEQGYLYALAPMERPTRYIHGRHVLHRSIDAMRGRG